MGRNLFQAQSFGPLAEFMSLHSRTEAHFFAGHQLWVTLSNSSPLSGSCTSVPTFQSQRQHPESSYLETDSSRGHLSILERVLCINLNYTCKVPSPCKVTHFTHRYNSRIRVWTIWGPFCLPEGPSFSTGSWQTPHND